MSAYFKEHRDEYYNRLQAVRDLGDVEGWMRFFLTAVWHVSREAADTAREIMAMREEHHQLIQGQGIGSVKGLELLDRLYEHPFTTASLAATHLSVSYPTANNLVGSLARLGLLKEITGRARNRLFLYSPYLELLEKGIGQQADPTG